MVWHNLCCWSKKQLTSVSWKYKSNNRGKNCNHEPGDTFFNKEQRHSWFAREWTLYTVNYLCNFGLTWVTLFQSDHLSLPPPAPSPLSQLYIAVAFCHWDMNLFLPQWFDIVQLVFPVSHRLTVWTSWSRCLFFAGKVGTRQRLGESHGQGTPPHAIFGASSSNRLRRTSLTSLAQPLSSAP